MIDEILKKFPEMIRAMLEKAEQTSSSETPERKKAREKLLAQLKDVANELTRLSNQEGETLSEEQMKNLVNIKRPAPSIIPPSLKGNKK